MNIKHEYLIYILKYFSNKKIYWFSDYKNNSKLYIDLSNKNRIFINNFKEIPSIIIYKLLNIIKSYFL